MVRSLLVVAAGLLLVLSASCEKAEQAAAAEPVNEAVKERPAPPPELPKAAPEAPRPAADPGHDLEAIEAAQSQIEGPKHGCADSAAARAKRQQAKPLYTRLGHEACTPPRTAASL
jgi:hypothetical protein